MGARSGGGGGFGGATGKIFGQRIGTHGTYTIMGVNGRKDFYGNKTFELYIEGNKGSTTLSFNSAAEGNKIIKQISKNGFSTQKGYHTSFNG